MTNINLKNRLEHLEQQIIEWDERIHEVESVGRNKLTLKRVNTFDYSKLYDGAKVKCIMEDDYDGTLIPGKVYEVTKVNHIGGGVSWKILDDSFKGEWFVNERTDHLFVNY